MPAEISFYVLASHTRQQRLLYVCRLVEKIYRSGLYPYIIASDDSLAEQLDQLLWTFRPGSFVAHERFAGQSVELPQTVLIGTMPVPEDWQTILINLDANIPTDLSRCQRVVEIVDADPEIKQAGRERYRQYKQQVLDIKTFDIGTDQS